MAENFLPSFLTIVYSWFTPTVLFVLLNLVIGTIAVMSGFGTQKNHKQPQLSRTHSVLERFKSFNLYRYSSDELNPTPSVTSSTAQPPETAVTHQTIEQPAPAPVEEPPVDEHEVRRSYSEKGVSSDKPVKQLREVRSAVLMAELEHLEDKEEIVDLRRPSTVKEGKGRGREVQHFGEDPEVDAKANDFINRFKQQLKLQRLESFKRYKEMLTRGIR